MTSNDPLYPSEAIYYCPPCNQYFINSASRQHRKCRCAKTIPHAPEWNWKYITTVDEDGCLTIFDEKRHAIS